MKPPELEPHVKLKKVKDLDLSRTKRTKIFDLNN